MIFLSFQNLPGFYNFILIKNLLLYIRPLIYLFALGRDRLFDICFEETLIFNFLYKLFNKYSPYLRALANLVFQ